MSFEESIKDLNKVEIQKNIFFEVLSDLYNKGFKVILDSTFGLYARFYTNAKNETISELITKHR